MNHDDLFTKVPPRFQCPSCGGRRPDESGFCHYCGRRFMHQVCLGLFLLVLFFIAAVMIIYAFDLDQRTWSDFQLFP